MGGDRADGGPKKERKKKKRYETYVVVFDLISVVLTVICCLALFYAYRSYALQKTKTKVLSFGEVYHMILKDGMMYKKNPRSIAMSDSYSESKKIYSEES